MNTSSPPLFPQSSFEDVPSSPPALLTTSSTSSSSRPPGNSAALKRPLESENTLSSDPLFSDDTSGNEDAAGYSRPKRKRMVKGPWWEVGRRDLTTPKQKDYARNMDSGVWMGSDESIESVDSMDSVGMHRNRMNRSNVRNRPRSVQTPRTALQRPTPHTVAADLVNRCVEEGLQRIDLSQLGLTELASTTLKPLHELIRQPIFDATLPPSDDEFGPLTPDLQLFLATNGLTSLPDELFRLENITVLSLRNNALTELPSAISRLCRLKELNVANNAIRYLPWELLEILASRQTRVIVHPNPLLMPLVESLEHASSPLVAQLHNKESQDISRHTEPRAMIDSLRQRCAADGTLDMRMELELRLQLGHMLCREHIQAAEADRLPNKSREELIYLVSSAVQFNDMDGRPCRTDNDTNSFLAHIREPDREDESPLGRAPSLLELSLRSVQQYFDLSSIPEAMPARIRSILHTARSLLHEQRCSTCRRSYIIPRAQWIEYWYHGLSATVEVRSESVLPLMRQACSWACAIPTETGTFRA